MSFRKGFKAEANRISLRVRNKLGLSKTDPIDPAEVCIHFELELLFLSEVEPTSPFLTTQKSKFSAVTVPRGWRQAIVVNDSHHPHRQNSSICHELAHCFLGHECVPPLTEEGERNHNGGIEAEANFLGGSLLIPNDAANHILKAGIKARAQALYGVSNKMLNYRLQISGANIIHQRRRKKFT